MGDSALHACYAGLWFTDALMALVIMPHLSVDALTNRGELGEKTHGFGREVSSGCQPILWWLDWRLWQSIVGNSHGILGISGSEGWSKLAISNWLVLCFQTGFHENRIPQYPMVAHYILHQRVVWEHALIPRHIPHQTAMYWGSLQCKRELDAERERSLAATQEGTPWINWVLLRFHGLENHFFFTRFFFFVFFKYFRPNPIRRHQRMSWHPYHPSESFQGMVTMDDSKRRWLGYVRFGKQRALKYTWGTLW